MLRRRKHIVGSFQFVALQLPDKSDVEFLALSLENNTGAVDAPLETSASRKGALDRRTAVNAPIFLPNSDFVTSRDAQGFIPNLALKSAGHPLPRADLCCARSALC